MKKFKLQTPKISRLPILLLLMTMAIACEININEDDECLQCRYKFQSATTIEEVCDPATEDEKQDMRIRMIEEADSLGVTVECFRH